MAAGGAVAEDDGRSRRPRARRCDVVGLDLVLLVGRDPDAAVGPADDVAGRGDTERASRRRLPLPGAVGVEGLDQVLACGGDEHDLVGGVPADADRGVEAALAAADPADGPEVVPELVELLDAVVAGVGHVDGGLAVDGEVPG